MVKPKPPHDRAAVMRSEAPAESRLAGMLGQAAIEKAVGCTQQGIARAFVSGCTIDDIASEQGLTRLTVERMLRERMRTLFTLTGDPQAQKEP